MSDLYMDYEFNPINERNYNMMTFGEAIKQMHNGQKVCRAGWNGKGMWLAIQNPDENSKMTLPYIYMKTADNNLVPWLASQTDMLAIDWQLLA